MRTKYLNLICVTVAACSLATQPVEAAIQISSITTLSNVLSNPRNNFNPQGLGYDPEANELLFSQQRSRAIFRTDLSGTVLGSVSINGNHSVSAAADSNNYYYSDYTTNRHGLDLLAVPKSGGAEFGFSTERLAFGGYPIDVRNGLLYRTDLESTTYTYSNLNQIRISSIGSPDTITNTLTLPGVVGIGDFAIDTTNNAIWTLDYAASALIRKFDLNSGAFLDSYDFGLDGLTAGLTVDNGGNLYHYDWNSGSGSVLTTFSQLTTGAVPEPTTLLVWSGLFGCCLTLRSYRKVKIEGVDDGPSQL